MIFASIYVARTLRASFFGVDIPIAALTAITCSTDDVRATFTLTGFLIANTIFRAAYVTVTAYKEMEKKEKWFNEFRFREFCFERGLKQLSL